MSEAQYLHFFSFIMLRYDNGMRHFILLPMRNASIIYFMDMVTSTTLQYIASLVDSPLQVNTTFWQLFSKCNTCHFSRDAFF